MGLSLRSPVWTKAKYALYRLIGLTPATARYLDLYLSRRAYRKAFGNDPDLSNPVLFGEKMTVRKLFDRRPIFRQLADKLQMREFVARKLGEAFLPRLLAVHDRFDDIDFDSLPKKFVIKANHGSHWVIVVEDKGALDRRAARATVRGWMKMNYYVNSREVFYRDVKPRIMIEECLEEASGAPVLDYKLFTFDGVVKFICVSRRSTVTAGREVAFFNRDYRLLPIRVEFGDSMYKKGKRPEPGASARPQASHPILPTNIDRLIEIAEALAQGFDHIRVDLYSPGGRILVGELTSLSNGGVHAYEPIEYERLLGDCWNLVLS